MDPPATVSVESKPESKPDESKPNNPKSYDCGLCDTEVVYKIAQELLPGLASACVDNTTGGLFKNAGTVAVDMRKEMSDYLTQRSETYVAEFLLSENTPVLETSEHPYDIIITLIDDFAASKRNMFSRVSEWVSSDGREDRIDDFVQEMEINGFWLLARRECIASILLKNVDYKNSFHCNVACGSEEEICKHRLECKFRGMDCVNEGCTTRYCAAQKENHEAICPFMILACEQKCPDFVMRREMDRHCVTICPMKLVNCAFYTVGCKSCIPKCDVQKHNTDDLSGHLLLIIRTAHKEANENDLKHRVEQIRSLTNTEKLARARDARALTFLIKDAEAKLGPLESKANSSPDLPKHDDINKIDPPKETEPLIVKDDSAKTEPLIVKDDSAKTEPLIVKDDSAKTEPSIVKDDSVKTEPPVVKDESKEDRPVPPPENPAVKEVHQEPPPKPVESPEERKDKQDSNSNSPPIENGESKVPIREEETKELLGKPSDTKEEEKARSPKGEEVKESMKTSIEDEKSKNGDEEDKKKSPEKGTIEESTK
ncbi:unnamed protein product [Lactuca virosa]|uniref:TRAF-type domain-containing protein n=1 Tax=Lactuca virosa TaxID=75947 RepID=A0AAU9NGA7_9ASTR|nr:unnamed protein product [Lactuca virosa]